MPRHPLAVVSTTHGRAQPRACTTAPRAQPRGPGRHAGREASTPARHGSGPQLCPAEVDEACGHNLRAEVPQVRDVGPGARGADATGCRGIRPPSCAQPRGAGATRRAGGLDNGASRHRPAVVRAEGGGTIVTYGRRCGRFEIWARMPEALMRPDAAASARRRVHNRGRAQPAPRAQRRGAGATRRAGDLHTGAPRRGSAVVPGGTRHGSVVVLGGGGGHNRALRPEGQQV